MAQRNEVASWRVHRINEPEESQPVFALESEKTHLFDYWKVIVKRYPLLLAIAFIVFSLGAYFTLTATTLYTAASMLKIEPQNPTVTGVSTGATDMLPAQTEGTYDYYGTQFALLQSRTLAARVIRELNLESKPQFNTTIVGINPVTRVSDSVFGAVQSRLDALYGAFQAAKRGPNGGASNGVSSHSISRYLELLEVKPVKNTRLVEVRFSTPDADLSKTLASAHAASFIRMILESRFELTKEARDFLDKKNAELRDKLQKAEAELNRFRQTHGVVSLDKGENIVVERLVDINKQLTGARAARIQAESLYRVVQNKNYNNLAEVMNHALIQQLKGTVATLEAEKARLSSIFMPEHPRMIEITRQANEARQTLNREVSTIVHGIESSYNAAKAREEALQAEAERQQQTALDLKEVGVQYAVLQEEVNVNRTLYESVLKRLHETNVSNDLAASNMQIVQQAELPLTPSAPRTARTLLLVVVLSMLVGVGGVFLVEYLDSTMHTPQEVWTAVGLNTVGTIPQLNNSAVEPATNGAGRSIGDYSKRYLPDSKPSSNGHSVSNEILGPRSQLSIIAESYRTIRTSLMLSQAERPPQVILVTSPCPGDGKTVTTLNLGIVLAQGGHRVLAIDADLRKGRCHKVLGLQNFYGLSNFLTGHLSLEKSIQAGPVDGLSLLSRGLLPPNPADLLCSRKMKEALNTLRESYDFILIDSPPVNAVSDAALLSAICDGVLLVFNSEQTGIDSARRTVERLEALGAKLIGVVLNGIDISNPDYADFRTYYPSYSQSEEEPLRDDKTIEHPPEFTGERREPDQLANGVLSKQSVEQIVQKLSEAVGPMAAVIVRDAAASMGETLDAFPLKKLEKLLDMTSEEILDPGLKRRFQVAMSDELRSRHV